MEVLSMIPQGDPDLTAYLHELLKTKNPEQQNILLKRFDWVNTLLKETEEQAIEDVLVGYHDIFARHSMDIGMNT